MAIVVIDIHSNTALYWESSLAREINFTLVDCSVPVFFVLSSYFVFRKLQKQDTWNPILKFERRINILYLCWIAVLLPIILLGWHKEYLESGLMTGLALFIRNYFFGFQFGASWFFGALIVGVPLIYLLQKVVKQRFVWVLPVTVYLYLNNADEHHGLFAWYAENLRTPLLSFPNGLLWICIGYYLTSDCIFKFINKIPCWAHLIIILTFLAVGVAMPDYRYLARVPATVSILLLFWNLRVSLDEQLCKFLRNCSIIMFCLHYSLIIVIGRFYDNRVILFLVATIFTVFFAVVLLKISGMSKLKWLKYFY